jgi:mono/diheme cytochrome c family protein
MKHTPRSLAFVMILLLAILLAACSSTPQAPVDPTPLAYSGSADTELEERAAQMAEAGDAEAGKEVFSRYCQTCHSVEDAVQIVGPSLFAAGDRFQFGYILASIENPHDVEAEGGYELIMPEDLVTRLSQQELNDVVAYVATLQK